MALNISILGAGFIGKNLLASCIGLGYSVRVLDRNLCPIEFSSYVDWVHGLLMNTQDVSRAVRGSDVVFHLISSTVPGDKVDETEELLSNVVQTVNLLKICVREGVKRVVFVSSSSVYGLKGRLPIPETEVTDPISSHGINELTIEKYLQLYKYEHGLNCKIMRLSNPYGIGQDLYGRQGFISIIIGKILSGEPIIIRGNGTAIRDYLYIDDVIQAGHLLARTNSDEVIFNIGSGQGVCLNEVVSKIQEITGIELLVQHVEERGSDIPASILDISKARNILGYKPSISLNEGLKRTLTYYRII